MEKLIYQLIIILLGMLQNLTICGFQEFILFR